VGVWVPSGGDYTHDEVPAEFFLDYAWSPGRWPVTRLPEWLSRWAAEQFGAANAVAIADILHRYELLQSDRKPELLNRLTTWDRTKDLASDPEGALIYSDADPFSLVSYAEHQRVTDAWQRLASDAEQLRQKLPAAAQDAYFELVLYNVKASANVYALRLAQFTGSLYADQGRAMANDMAALANARFQDDQDMNTYYNTVVAGGKWWSWASQPHIGYGRDSPWQQPERDNAAIPDFIWPELKLVAVPPAASMGVAIDGSTKWWPGETATQPVLPTFSPYQSQSAQYIDVFNRGAAPFSYQASVPATDAGFVTVLPGAGTVTKQVRIGLQINWAAVPPDRLTVPVTITGSDGTSVTVSAVLDNRPLRVAGAPDPVPWTALNGFVEANGYVSMEADHFTGSVSSNGITWFQIPDIGRTGSGMTVLPRNAALQTPGGAAPHLEYQMYLAGTDTSQVEVWTYLSPRNSVRIASGDQDGLLYAISIDDEPPQLINVTHQLAINPQANNGNGNKPWEWKAGDNIIRFPTTHAVTGGNPHVLKYWMVDPTVIAQKFVVDTGGLQPSYLGPMESCRAPAPCHPAQ
jgi:hypothetical protein